MNTPDQAQPCTGCGRLIQPDEVAATIIHHGRTSVYCNKCDNFTVEVKYVF